MHLNTSYLSMSIFLAYAVMFPEEYFYIYFILAIKAKWLALFDAFFLVFGFVYGSLHPSESPFSCPLPTSSFSS